MTLLGYESNRTKANMKLTQHNYGKAKVRVMKVTRNGAQHILKELDVSVMLQGDFDASYTRSDNSLVVATDSMKNTVNVFAKEKLGAENEEFGVTLGEHFLKTYRQIERVEIGIAERIWDRMQIGGKAHNHAFAQKDGARPTARVVSTRAGATVESGVEDMLILKSTESGFENFVMDKFTTLPPTNDRIFATKLKAAWLYDKKPQSYSAANAKIMEVMLDVFATTFSPSVQVTLFQMGEAALRAVSEISKVNLAMPNKHCLLINLKPFGLENQNELFVPTDEPHGQIEGTVSRI
jgi:urate oxidase